MKRVHYLKSEPRYFQAVKNWGKNFEIRKDDRRPRFSEGDFLVLAEYFNGELTGNKIAVEITYILRNCPEHGLKKGYCVLGIRQININHLKCEEIEELKYWLCS